MLVDELVKDGLARKLNITIPSDDLYHKLNEKLEGIRRKANIKGFRPGKVPISYVRKMFSASTMAEILESEVSNSVTKALSDRCEKPVMTPIVDVDQEKDHVQAILNDKSPFEFKVTFDLFPEFDIQDISKIKLDKFTTSVKDKDVKEFIDKLAKSHTEYQLIKSKQRKVKDKDRVVLSFNGFIDGKEFEGGKADDFSLVIGEGRMIDGFEEQVIGLKVDEEEHEVKVTFPDEYHSKKLAGKEAIFKVQVKAIEQPVNLLIDDEFAKKIGFTTLEDLKKTIIGQIEKEDNIRSRLSLKKQVFDHFDEHYSFELPNSGVNNEVEQLKEKYLKEHNNSIDKDEEKPGEIPQDKMDEITEIAKRRVRSGLILRKIAEDSKIEVSNDELESGFRSELAKYPGKEKQVQEYYTDNPQAVSALRMSLLEEKVSEHLFEVAQIEEKSLAREEFNKLVDGDA